MSRLMKIVLIFAICILSFTFGEDGSSSNNRSPEDELRDIIMNSVNVTHAAAKELCDRANLSAVSQAIDNDYERLVNCVTDHYNYTVVSTVREMNLTDYDDTRLLPKLLCDSIPPFSKCLSDFEKIMKPCFPEFVWGMVEFGQNMTTTAQDFICRDNHANFDRFVATDGISCINSSPVKDCMLIVDLVHKPLSDPHFGSSLQQLFKRICKSDPDVQTCVIREMRKCSNQKPADIVNDLINEVKAVSPCANQVEGILTNL